MLLYSYHENYWYWESLDIFRKYLLTSVVLVVAHDSLLQVYLGVLICNVSLVFVSRHQPYASPFCGQLQLLCLAQLGFTYLSGMLFFANGDDAWSWAGDAIEGLLDEDGWSVVLIVANLLGFAMLTVGMGSAARAALGDVQTELAQRREEELKLRAQVDAMRAALDSPSPSLSRARIALSDLELGESLGRGQFGEVFSATLHGTPVAVKRLHSLALLRGARRGLPCRGAAALQNAPPQRRAAARWLVGV